MFNNWFYRKIKGIIRYAMSTKSIYLVNTPEHGNIGDHAIAIAEMNYLKDNGLDCYEITGRDLSNVEWLYGLVSKLKKNDVYLYTGGGFLGDLWLNEENMFQSFLKAFSKKKIIVLPQTISFDMNSGEGINVFKSSKSAYESHDNLTVFVREMNSFRFMKKNMPNVKTILAPDMVLMLKVEQRNYRRNSIKVCLRNDKESTFCDFEKSKIDSILQKVFVDENIEHISTVKATDILREYREEETDLLLNNIQRAKIVITDRLHGMIFSAITGTPCVAFSNSNHKVDGVYDWISNLPYVRLVHSLDEMGSEISNMDLEKKYDFPREEFIGLYSKIIEEIKEK